MSIPSSVEELIALIEQYITGGMTDGLPVIPPSRAGVEATIAATGRDADEVLGVFPPKYQPVTVQDVAVNAAMAGCLPEHVPVVLAALEAMLEHDFNLAHMQLSTKGVAPLVIVNGPIRHTLQINCGGNVFGPGHRANAAIGRALRLLMFNVGGATSQVLDRATFGHPGKFTYVIGEDEEDSPWEPLHVECGFEHEQSVVTVVPCEAPRSVNTTVADEPEHILTNIADTMRTLGSFGFSGPAEAVVLLGPENRSHIARAGWTKQHVREYLFEHCQRPAHELQAVNSAFPGAREAAPDAMIRQFAEPTDIRIAVAGGPGPFSVVVPGFASVEEERSQQRVIAT
jgi:hypothetical protein